MADHCTAAVVPRSPRHAAALARRTHTLALQWVRGAQRALRKQLRQIRRSALFDADWYLDRNPDVARSGVDPLRHFVQRGGAEGRQPSVLFDPV